MGRVHHSRIFNSTLSKMLENRCKTLRPQNTEGSGVIPPLIISPNLTSAPQFTKSYIGQMNCRTKHLKHFLSRCHIAIEWTFDQLKVYWRALIVCRNIAGEYLPYCVATAIILSKSVRPGGKCQWVLRRGRCDTQMKCRLQGQAIVHSCQNAYTQDSPASMESWSPGLSRQGGNSQRNRTRGQRNRTREQTGREGERPEWLSLSFGEGSVLKLLPRFHHLKGWQSHSFLGSSLGARGKTWLAGDQP